MATIERLGRENLDAIEETIKRYDIDCDWERTGELRVAVPRRGATWSAGALP